MVISHGRLAPCFAGVDVWIVESNVQIQGADQVGYHDDREVLSTQGWHPLGWGRELARHDVGMLLCSGIDQSTWASVQGHGIHVIPNLMGDASSVFETWRSGRLTPPRVWPAYLNGYTGLQSGRRGRERGRRRFRGGTGK